MKVIRLFLAYALVNIGALCWRVAMCLNDEFTLTVIKKLLDDVEDK